MKAFLNLIVPLLILLNSTCKQGQEEITTKHEISNKLTQRIDSIANEFIKQGKVMGLSIAIMDKSDTVYNKGFGYADRLRTKPVTTESIFKLASISKLIGATVVMKLVEERVLSLDQTLIELLPEFPNKEQAQKIKLSHLLSHTSGLQDYASYIDTVYLQTRVEPTKRDFYEFFKARELFFEPGSNYSYCNSGFLLMGLIVERITASSWQNQIDRIVNQPTGLNLKLIAENADHPQMSEYFELSSTELVPRPFWKWIKGDGGLTTTPLELAHFPMYWSSGKIINEKSFQQMSKPTELNDGLVTGYGLGVRHGEFEGEKVIGHTGGNKTNLSIMVYFPERELGVVVCVNTDNTTSQARAIFAPIALAVLGKEFPNFKNQETPSDSLARFEGKFAYQGYKSDQEVSVELNPDNNHLYYRFDSTSKGEKLYYLGDNKFWIARWPFDRIIFDLDDHGQARALKEYYSGFYVLLRKKVN